MSLSTLLEAAKYLDYLDSSNDVEQSASRQVKNEQEARSVAQGQHNLNAISPRRPIRRPRATKNQDGTMVAMSLPTTGIIDHPYNARGGLPLPSSAGSSSGSQAGLLSSSFTAASPLSSPLSTALLSSKTSGVTSNISSAASSLSSSDSSSSCGEILMSDLDFDQYGTSVGSSSTTSAIKVKSSSSNRKRNKSSHDQSQIDSMDSNNIKQQQQTACNNTNINNLQSTHQYEAKPSGYNPNNSIGSLPQPIDADKNDKRSARCKPSRSAGPKILTLTVHPNVASASVPIEGNLRAGRVIQAAKSNTTNSCHFSLTMNDTIHQHHYQQQQHQGISCTDNKNSHHPFMSICASNFNSTPSSSISTPGNVGFMPSSHHSACLPTGSMIMARVEPMILNSLAPSAQQSIMAFEQATTSHSPTSTNSSYSRHRELHKTLEKNRRAHLRHCFELLKAELPGSDCIDRKTSHINIIKSAIRCVLSLREQEVLLDNEYKSQLEIKNRLSEQLGEQSKDKLLLQKHPVAEQQLSFLLSRSRID